MPHAPQRRTGTMLEMVGVGYIIETRGASCAVRVLRTKYVQDHTQAP